MRNSAFAALAGLLVFAGVTSAEARPRDEGWNPFVQKSSAASDNGRATTYKAKRQRVANRGRAERVRYATRQNKRYATHRSATRRAVASRGYESAASYSGGGHGAGPRPRAWCGWWMRTQRGGGSHLNLAWNWSKWGSPSGPQVGAVVVWRHHVGEIVGRAPNGQWLVRSGNDGGAVRTRARSVAGAVFRVG
ncbi:hypothetical protein [Hyphomicrobium sp. LHD-15]|uniref:hypothetical protein n=1 Tax=Hyphomicrobium sp. LHD-15 TaxID=3072142 RepID=UPI00280CA4FA|nr:hypothetical protein [Hyphomicrobium sp. LHD-15]MDQ8699357.1 hypothetical protein [Hyphomicrobium sp. LHD-15]